MAYDEPMSKQKILVVGGGFGGIKVALELSKSDDSKFDLTLVSDQANFRYYPALYRTATGGVAAGSSIPLMTILSDKKVKIIQGTAEVIDRKAQTLTLADGEVLDYDIVILGLGVVTNYFGIPGMENFSYSIKSFDAIKRFKEHLHNQIEDERRPDLNYVIVGAGPTGIELAGALPEYLRKVMEIHGVEQKAVYIDLIEAAPRLLPRMPQSVSLHVARRLRRKGVKLYTDSAVQGVAADQLIVGGSPIKSHTVVWTAGITNHPFFKNNGFMLTPHGKVATNLYLEADDNVFVVGDNANTPYSGMAQTAMHDGEYVAHVIKRRAKGKDPRSYQIHKPITVIPVGERWATVVWGRVRLSGITGWVLRELADLVAFTDYEPWWKAGRQWLVGFEEEEFCHVCQQAMHRNIRQIA
jgi:NADH:ubiquinone reductase (H+-translocating)